MPLHLHKRKGKPAGTMSLPSKGNFDSAFAWGLLDTRPDIG